MRRYIETIVRITTRIRPRVSIDDAIRRNTSSELNQAFPDYTLHVM